MRRHHATFKATPRVKFAKALRALSENEWGEFPTNAVNYYSWSTRDRLYQLLRQNGYTYYSYNGNGFWSSVPF